MTWDLPQILFSTCIIIFTIQWTCLCLFVIYRVCAGLPLTDNILIKKKFFFMISWWICRYILQVIWNSATFLQYNSNNNHQWSKHTTNTNYIREHFPIFTQFVSSLLIPAMLKFQLKMHATFQYFVVATSCFVVLTLWDEYTWNRTIKKKKIQNYNLLPNDHCT